MRPREAIAVLLAAVPEFRTVYNDESAQNYAGDGGEPMLHIVFGDLANFYERAEAGDPEFTSRFWRTVEVLARDGGRYVADDALAGSFIEYFCLGTDSQKRMIEDSAPQQGPATRGLVEWYWRKYPTFSTARRTESHELLCAKSGRSHSPRGGRVPRVALSRSGCPEAG